MINIDNWQIKNENHEHWSLNNGVLSMQVQEGNIFGSGSAEVDNIFIHKVSKPTYSAEVTVNLDPNRSFEQAGLGIYWDNDNYIKISKEMFMGERSLVFVVEKQGRPDIKKQLSFNGSKVSIKLEKDNDEIHAYYRADINDEWSPIMSLQSLPGAEQGVMLYTFSGSNTNSNIARFSDFQLLN